VVSFTPRPLYSREDPSRYALNRRLVGPQKRSAYFGGQKNVLTVLVGTRRLTAKGNDEEEEEEEEENILLLPGVEKKSLSHPASSLATIPTELNRTIFYLF
jgi:hypothetical protein